MATVQHRQGVYVSTDEAQAALMSGTKIEIQETGKTVNIAKSIYSYTNFWIDQSRDYVGDHKLTPYLHIIFLNWVFPVIFFISLFSPSFFIFAFVMLVIGVAFLLVFTQHMYVSIKTLPHILKQPRVPDRWLESYNAFFEITIDKYQAFFAASSQAGIGHIVAETGKVKIQVFRNEAFLTMKKCIALSTLYFFMAGFMVVYCFAWGIIGIALFFL